MLEESERRRERVHAARVVRMKVRGDRMNDKRRLKGRASRPFELLPAEGAHKVLSRAFSSLLTSNIARHFVVAIIRDDGL